MILLENAYIEMKHCIIVFHYEADRILNDSKC